jgi:hypothetical protein
LHTPEKEHFCSETDLSHGGSKVPVNAVLMSCPDEELAMTTNDTKFNAISVDELHLACVLDEHGHEIPITREMIEKACGSLIENLRTPRVGSLN